MDQQLIRRDFNRLSFAAMTALASGASAAALAAPGESNGPSADAKAADAKTKDTKAVDPKAGDAKPVEKKPPERVNEVYEPPEVRKYDWKGKKKKEGPVKEMHICRGLNTCKGFGRSGENKCAGQGDCATTVNAPHECSTGNACKGQGGCNGAAGKNECAGRGDGSVPINDDEWPPLRAAFEAKMRRLNKKFGDAPPSDFELDSQRRWQEAEAKALAEMEEAKRAAAEGRPAGERRPREPKDERATRPRPGTKQPIAPTKREKEGEAILDDLIGDKDRDKTKPGGAKPDGSKPDAKPGAKKS